LFSALVLLLGATLPAAAQFQEGQAKGPKVGQTVTERWRVGMVVTAGTGPCRGVVAITSAPADWPEQQVRVVDEDVSRGVDVSYRIIDGAVRQMTTRIQSLAAGEEARALVTFEVKRSTQLPPDDTGIYVLPNAAKRDRKLRAFLTPSPYIESTSPRIKTLAGEIGVEEPRAWDRVEAVYDWVQENVELVDNRGGVVKTTQETLRDGTGDCDEMTSLFIAICRAGGVPARTVRVPRHCYGEFYLEDDEAQGHWFACDATRPDPFGEVADERPILQKGDNLLLVDPSTRGRKKKYRFLPDSVRMADQRGSAPRVRMVLERASE